MRRNASTGREAWTFGRRRFPSVHLHLNRQARTIRNGRSASRLESDIRVPTIIAATSVFRRRSVAANSDSLLCPFA